MIYMGRPLPATAQMSSNQDDEEESSSSSSSGSSVPNLRGYETNIYGATTLEDSELRSTYDLERILRARFESLDNQTKLKIAEPGEFELYVERMVGRPLRRFGADLILPEDRDFAMPATATVPPDYRLNVGDVISISLAGSVEGSFERTVDTNGNIFLPSVGSIHVAGVRHGDLGDVLGRAIGTQYRNFRFGVRLAELRGIRVYVTGFANNPGAFSVSSLSTIANAIFQAGGPNSNGSMRTAKLIRNGQEVADFDLYELLLGGSRVNDAVLENEDVIFIPPAGRQVAVIGSVSLEAIYELRASESLSDVLRLAGGATQLADAGRLVVYRAGEIADTGPLIIGATEATSIEAMPGDIIQVLAEKSLAQPTARQSMIVRIEGEVARPGNYSVPAGTPLNDVVELAGGMTSRAYPFGAELKRTSVAVQQKQSFLDAINQFEMTLASAPLTADSSVDPARAAAQREGARQFLDKLRETEPDGRLILEIEPNAANLPSSLVLENGDQIYVPPRPSSIGVFGAVYRPASYMIGDRSKKIRDYIDMAGGPVRAADKGDLFVVRANGAVVPRSEGALGDSALPGDVVFIPVKTSSTDLLTKIGQISTILFQFGIAAATVAAID